MNRSPILLLLAALALLALAACETPDKSKTDSGTGLPAPAADAAKPAAPVEKVGDATAVIETTAGKLTCKLFGNQTPKTVANFVGLAEGTKDWTNPASHSKKHGVPFYEGTIFHRVIPNFMIQGGDPLGNGSGDVGFTIPDELLPELKFNRPGRLAMANELLPDTGSSQFFITEIPNPGLDACFEPKGCTRGSRWVPKGYGFTIFGQCDEATVVLVRKIARMPRDERTDRPFSPVKITKITIIRDSAKPEAVKKGAAK